MLNVRRQVHIHLDVCVGNDRVESFAVAVVPGVGKRWGNLAQHVNAGHLEQPGVRRKQRNGPRRLFGLGCVGLH